MIDGIILDGASIYAHTSDHPTAYHRSPTSLSAAEIIRQASADFCSASASASARARGQPDEHVAGGACECMAAALQIAFAAISVAVVVAVAYFLHTCSREATPIPPPMQAPPPGTAAAVTGGDVELGAAGMDEAAISALPRVVVAHGGEGSAAEASCAVCLGDYDRGDVLRVLPGCEHSFHRPCVDQWLRLRPSCPVCRTPPAPTAPSPATTSS